ncbi:T9SS sorting signal type C domain-containing protein [Flavobacterium daemonense]|uniref:T9SS sorting signal type C domain-containing protein n=1 Tax=Flavobacterium daemonense TaxID=1393049 RepID=UPI0013A62D17|nr:T9SS sorting signal type C domain-containing protein [Flavobacterium daemonense]KAF2335532.1 T9SS sorting signal type C domain-containing protein [Flavobacterium daemonense]
MIRKLLLSFLFSLFPFLKIRAEKFSFKIAFVAFFLGFSLNSANAQCNTASTGTVSSNTDKMCVGTNQTFSSNGWGGGTWTSSNPSVLQNVGNSEFKAIAAGTADVIYSITQSGCSEVKSSRKTITVYNALGTIGEITGTSPQCEKISNQVYSVSPVANATNYVWTVPNGWSIDSGAGTNSITVTVGNPNQGGNITVYATNSCASTSTKSLYSNVNPTIKQTPNATGATNTQCTYAMLTWNNVNNATGFYLDIATDINFTNFVGIYKNYDVAYNNGSSPVYDLPPGTLYYRVRGYNSCTITDYSTPRSFSTIAPVGGSASSPQTICSGATPANLTLANNTGTVLYWEKSATSSFTSATQINNSASTTLLGTTIGPLTANTYFRAVVTGSNCNSYSNSVLITIGNSISAASSSPTICANTPLTAITHTTSGFTGIGTPSNLPPGTSAGFANNTVTISGTPTTAGTYDYSIPLTGGTCGSGSANATGRIIVNPILTASVNIAASPSGPICPGTSVTFTATATNGGTPSYQWKLNNVTTGTNSATYTSSTLANNDVVTCVMTSTASPCLAGSPATSNSITMVVNPTKTASVTITSDQSSSTICQGTHVRFTAQPVNGGNAPTYQWYNGTTLLTETSNSYLAYNVTSTDAFKVVMTSNASPCLTGSPATSNTMSFSVITTDRGRTQGGTPICQGTATPKLKLVNFDAPNQGAAYSYPTKVVRWEYSTDGNNTWTPIPGTQGLIEYQPAANDPLSNLAVTTTFRAVAQTTGCAQEFKAIETEVTVKPLPTVTFTTQPTSDVVTQTNVTYTTQAGQNSYLWTVTGTLNTDYSIVSGSLTSNTVTLKWLTTGSKTVTVNYKNSYNGNANNGCYGATPATNTIMVTDPPAPPAPPTVGTITQPTCAVPTGSITLTNLPNSGTLLRQGPNTTNATYTITGNTMTISGLAVGTYAFAISSAFTPAYTDPIVIDGSKKWNGTSWTGNTDPTSNDVLIFAGDYSLNKDIEGCSCTVNNNAKVTIKTGKTMTITNFIHVDSGSLNFENNASLIQTNPDATINTGNISYIRNSLPIRQADFVYWSSPVKGYTLAGVSPATSADKYFTYNGTQWISVARTTEMIVGKGYIIRGPDNYSNTQRQAFTATFTGVPNNGTLSGETVSADKFYLVGNPYPSALDGSKFILDNNNKNLLTGTLYFWTHNTLVVLSGAYQYNADDYASYNVTGGVRTSAITGTTSGNNNEAPTGQIGAGQSFFVGAKAAGTIKFDNTMRSGGTNNSQFFKPATAKTTGTEKHRLWLNMTNDEGAFKQLLVGYVEGATNKIDFGYDGETFDGNKYLDFYSINENTSLVIQGRGLPFSDSDTVPLGYRTTIAGNFTIAIDAADGDLKTQKIYLEDKTTSVIYDLTAGNYTFTTGVGTFQDRFVLRYTNKSLGTGDFENVKDGVLVSIKDKIIKVLSSNENLKEVDIYDISGKVLYNKTKINATELQISNLQSGNGVLIAKVILENGSSISKKIIFQ